MQNSFVHCDSLIRSCILPLWREAVVLPVWSGKASEFMTWVNLRHVEGMSLPGKRNGMYKGPEAETCLRNCKEAGIAGVQQKRGEREAQRSEELGAGQLYVCQA